MADVKQNKPVNRGVQFAEPYPSDNEMETVFNAWKKGGEEELAQVLDRLHPEGWARGDGGTRDTPDEKQRQRVKLASPQK